MSGDFDALFDEFQHSAFRYEGREVYNVGGAEADRIQAWREHKPRPERSVRTSPWLRRIAITTAAGKEWSRVRAVDEPLPEYLRYELSGYVESQAAGDRVLLVNRENASHGRDFWLFDGGTSTARAALMNYTETGEFLGFEAVTDRDALADLEATRQRLLAAATPLNVWLARMERTNA